MEIRTKQPGIVSRGARRGAKWAAFVSILLGVSASTAIFYLMRGRGNGAELVCKQPNYSFGDVSVTQAAMLTHEFVVENPTSHSIQLVKHFTSCGCTAAFPSAKEIPPGRHITIPVEVNWRDRDGKQSARVFLVTDDQRASPMVLSIAADVKNPVAVEPRVIDFGLIDPGPSAEKTFDVIEGASGAGVRVTSIRTTSPSVMVTRVAPAGSAAVEGGPGRFAVQLIAPLQPGPQLEKVFVSTSVSATPITVLVSCRSKGMLQVEPASLLFDFRTSRSTQAATITVRVVAPGNLSKVPILEARTESHSDSFQVAGIKQPVAAGTGLAIVNVRCIRPASPTAVGTLRLSVGQESIGIPVVALGADSK